VFLGSSGVTIIAQENVKKTALLGAGRPLRWLARWSLPFTGAPNSNLFKKHVLRQGPQQLTLVNYGPAHTDGDTIIYIAPANVAVVGDIFSNPFYPIIDLASGDQSMA